MKYPQLKKIKIGQLVLIMIVLVVAVYYLVVGVCLLVSQIGTGTAAENEKKLLEEEAVWIDESKQYKIVIEAEHNGGIIYDEKNGDALYRFYFGLPGEIFLVELDVVESDAYYARDHEIASLEWSYNKRKEVLKIITTKDSRTHVALPWHDEMTFSKAPN